MFSCLQNQTVPCFDVAGTRHQFPANARRDPTIPLNEGFGPARLQCALASGALYCNTLLQKKLFFLVSYLNLEWL